MDSGHFFLSNEALKQFSARIHRMKRDDGASLSLNIHNPRHPMNELNNERREFLKLAAALPATAATPCSPGWR